MANVNAGSNSVSAFAATRSGLRLIGTIGSGGTDPNSVTISGDHLVYVLNAGSKTIAGFWLGWAGLRPVQGSVRPLGAGAMVPRQIQFSNDGRVLVVDESGSNTIDTFVVGWNGTAGPAVTTGSTGGAPFGFDFDRAGYLLVSDAALSTGQSGATSYDVTRDGTVIANGPPVPIDQAASCWLAAAGRFAYTANAGSGSIGRYAVAPVDVGTSGGVWGLERGFCLMIGGESEVVRGLDPIFKTIAPGQASASPTPSRTRTDGTAPDGYLHCGPNGAGHLPGLEDFSGRVSDSGEGRSTVLAAVEEGVPAATIATSLLERFESRGLGEFTDKILSAMRSEFGGHAEKKQ